MQDINDHNHAKIQRRNFNNFLVKLSSMRCKCRILGGEIMDYDYNQYVWHAIQRTKQHDPEYFRKCIEQRLCNGKGSVTDFVHAEDLERALMNCDWYKYDHPAVAPGCLAFKTGAICGWLGMAPLKELDPNLMCTMMDVKGTGTLSLVLTDPLACVNRWFVAYTVIIIGDDGYGACMFTFHPGDPLPPSHLSSDGSNELGLKEGDKLTVGKAIELGFVHAKLQGEG